MLTGWPCSEKGRGSSLNLIRKFDVSWRLGATSLFIVEWTLAGGREVQILWLTSWRLSDGYSAAVLMQHAVVGAIMQGSYAPSFSALPLGRGHRGHLCRAQLQNVCVSRVEGWLSRARWVSLIVKNVRPSRDRNRYGCLTEFNSEKCVEDVIKSWQKIVLNNLRSFIPEIVV